MSVKLSIPDCSNWLNPWGPLGLVSRADFLPEIANWLDVKSPRWKVRYLKVKPHLILDDVSTANLFLAIWGGLDGEDNLLPLG